MYVNRHTKNCKHLDLERSANAYRKLEPFLGENKISSFFSSLQVEFQCLNSEAVEKSKLLEGSDLPWTRVKSILKRKRQKDSFHPRSMVDLIHLIILSNTGASAVELIVT